MTQARFRSPWSHGLKIITSIGLLAVGYALWTGHQVAAYVIVAVIFHGAFLSVRGYRIEGRALLIDRAGRSTLFDLDSLVAVEADPHAMEGSFRLLGTGLFAYVGLFRNARLGWYRVYATDPKRAVVLRFADRTVVVTPDDPEAFVRRVRVAMAQADSSASSERPRVPR